MNAVNPHSLVKGSKCPTGHSSLQGLEDFARDGLDVVKTAYERICQATGEISEFETVDFRDPVETGGTLAKLYRREWSSEWRLRCELETPGGLPPENIGDRVTSRLSDRGARAMGESCEFVTKIHGGYSTFLTLTVDKAARERINRKKLIADKKVTYLPTQITIEKSPVVELKEYEASDTEEPIQTNKTIGSYTPVEFKYSHYCGGEIAAGPYCKVKWQWESSIQKEASRFFDGLQKIWQRGWIPAYETGRKVTLKDGTEYTPIKNWNPEKIRIGGPDYGPVPKLFYLWVAENPKNEDGERNPHIHVLLRWRVPYGYFRQWAMRIEKLWGQGFATLEKLRATEAAGYYIAKAAGYLSKANGDSDQGPIRGNRYGMAVAARAPGWQPVLVWAWGVMGHLLQDAKEKWKGLVNPLRKTRDECSDKLKAIKKGKPGRQKVARLLTHTRKKLDSLPYFGRFGAVFRSTKSIDKFLCWAGDKGWAPDKKPPGMWLTEWLRRRRAKKTRRLFNVAVWNQAVNDSAFNFYSRWEPVEIAA